MNNDSTSKPRVSPRRASRRRSLPGGDYHATRFARRLASVLRNPLSAFLSVLALELKAPRPVDDDSECRIVFRVATWFLVAFCRILLVERWLVFMTEHPDIALTRATKQYLASMRRRGVRTSKSTLYKHSQVFERRGLVGLLPQWKGGRPRRIPPAERALLEDLYRKTNLYRLYCLIRKGAGLPARPMSRSTVQRIVKEFSEHHTPDIRQRATQRRPSGDSKNRRTPFRGAK